MATPRKKHVLMVDDDQSLCSMIRECMSLDGNWRLSAAHSGEEALAWLERRKPDVVLLDFDLGEGRMSGFEVLRRVRSNPALAGLPVVMVTGALLEPADAALGLDLGVDDFLTKPVPLPVLLARLGAAIEKVARGARAA